MEASSVQGRKGPSVLWLPVVLLVGIITGVVLSFFVPEPPFGYWMYRPFGLEWEIMTHVVLSTVSISLLIALSIVYLKLYSETGARFALGIFIVILALLIQAIIQYPLLLGLAVNFPIAQGRYFSFADIFTIAAYAIFLYLSLE